MLHLKFYTFLGQEEQTLRKINKPGNPTSKTAAKLQA